MGNILCGDDVILKKNVKVEGDVTAAGKVKLEKGAFVTGSIQEYTDVPSIAEITLVSFSISADGEDIEVKKGEHRILQPGSYGKLEVKEEA